MMLYVLSICLVVLDQVTKWYISGRLSLCEAGRCESIEILPVFKLLVLHNEGAAFSFLDDAGGWQRWFLVTVSSSVSVGLVIWIHKIRQSEKLLALALAFILGGAVGNLIDRALQGYVVDFLVVYYESYYFPAFNIADSAISIGAALLILDMFYPAEKRKAKVATTGSSDESVTHEH